MRQMYVPLPDWALDALRDLADREFRGAREQATVLILEGLQKRGYLDTSAKTPAKGGNLGAARL